MTLRPCVEDSGARRLEESETLDHYLKEHALWFCFGFLGFFQ